MVARTAAQRLSRWLTRCWQSPSQRFFVAALAFVAGVAAGSFVDAPVRWLMVALWVMVAALVGCWKYASLRLSVLVLLAFLGGAFRTSIATERRLQNPLLAYVGQSVTLSGTVIDDARPAGAAVATRVQVESLHATLPVLVSRYPEVYRGDQVELRCVIEARDHEPLCAFPDISIVARSTEKNLLDTARMAAQRSLERVFPEPSGGFIAGLLLGGTAALSDTWREALRATGTTHLVALSGYNVTIIAAFILAMAEAVALPRRSRVWLVATLLALFVIFVGGGASIVRAAIMGMIVVIGKQLGRSAAMTNVLLAAAGAMLLLDPLLLTESIGFQLSFLATVGMIFVAPHVEARLAHIPNPLGMRDALALSLAAEVSVLPLILWYFGTLSLVAPIVNLLVAPAIPVIMLFGFVALVAGLVMTTLGQVVGVAAWLLATYVLELIRFASAVPFASVAFVVPLWLVAVYYVGFFVLIAQRKRSGARATAPHAKLLSST